MVPVQCDGLEYLLEALQPGTPYALALRSDFRGGWTTWCRTVIATTLAELEVCLPPPPPALPPSVERPPQRGTAFDLLGQPKHT